MRRPRHAFLLATVLLGALWAIAPTVPAITPEEAVHHAGRTVRMAGTVVDVRAWDGGGAFSLVHAGYAVHAKVEGPVPPTAAWIEATGALRRDGELTLWVDAWHVAASPPGAPVPLAVVALAPEDWLDQRITVRGTQDGDALHDAGRWVMLGDGPRMPGQVDVTGVLAYAPRCLCHVLHVDQLRPWTS